MILISRVVSIIFQKSKLCRYKIRVIYFFPNCVNFLPGNVHFLIRGEATAFMFIYKSTILLNRIFIITPFKIRILEKPHSFIPRPLNFNLHKEFLKLNDIFVSWSSPKNWPGDKILKLEKSKFWEREFLSIGTI